MWMHWSNESALLTKKRRDFVNWLKRGKRVLASRTKKMFLQKRILKNGRKQSRGVLRNFAKFTGKHLCLKTRLWYRCFPVNFAKFRRTHFLQNTSGWLLLLLGFQKQPPEVLYKQRCSWKFRKSHRKTSVSEFFF